VGKKPGANRGDVKAIRRLEQAGHSAEYISDKLNINIRTVRSFMLYPATQDLDGDGKPDEPVGDPLGTTITKDADSINIDLNKDGKADLILPRT
jgi:hypothetical protein